MGAGRRVSASPACSPRCVRAIVGMVVAPGWVATAVLARHHASILRRIGLVRMNEDDSSPRASPMPLLDAFDARHAADALQRGASGLRRARRPTRCCAKSSACASRARMAAGRAQDRLHQPHDLAALRRRPADVGARVARDGAHAPDGTADDVACARRRAAHRARGRVRTARTRAGRAATPATCCDAVDWIAPGFEIVQSHFPGWKFSSADCTAAFGLHRALVVGPRTALDRARRATRCAASLPAFEAHAAPRRAVIDRGIGANVLDSPALALAHLARVLAEQPPMPPLAAGELVTTGTITDAWPVRAGRHVVERLRDARPAGLTVRFD